MASPAAEPETAPPAPSPEPTPTLEVVAATSLRKRRLSSLRSFIPRGPSGDLPEEYAAAERLFFPTIDDSTPARRASTEWNEFIQLGMADDKAGNPRRSIAARAKIGGSVRSGLGRSSIVAGEGVADWETMMSEYDFSKVANAAGGSSLAPFGDLAWRRNSSRSQAALLHTLPAFAPNRTIYGNTPIVSATTGFTDMIPVKKGKVKPPTVAAIKRAARFAEKALLKPPDHVGRPPNAWILYRSEQIRILKSENSLLQKPQSDISKFIGLMWRDETPAVRKSYEALAEQKKAEHAALHPDYQFRPVRKAGKNKVSAARQAAQVLKAEKAKAKAARPAPKSFVDPDFEISCARDSPQDGSARPHYDSYEQASSYNDANGFPSPPRTGDSSQTHSHQPVRGTSDFLSVIAPGPSYPPSDGRSTQGNAVDQAAWASYEASKKNWFPPTPSESHGSQSAPVAMEHFSFDSRSDLAHPQPVAHSRLNFPFPQEVDEQETATYDYNTGTYIGSIEHKNYQYSVNTAAQNPWNTVHQQESAFVETTYVMSSSPSGLPHTLPHSLPMQADRPSLPLHDEQRQIFQQQIPQSTFEYSA